MPIGIVNDVTEIRHGSCGRCGAVTQQKWPCETDEHAEKIVANGHGYSFHCL